MVGCSVTWMRAQILGDLARDRGGPEEQAEADRLYRQGVALSKPITRIRRRS